MGEVIKVSGRISLGEAASAEEDPLNSSDRQYPTEFELYLPTGNAALFTLDIPDQPDLISMMCLTVGVVTRGKLPDGVSLEFDGAKKLIRSPWAPNGRPLDVTGVPGGTEVECPYTGNMFMVP